MSGGLESVQFEVGLTRDKTVLQQLKKNKMWREDRDGAYLSIQFDAQEFKFRPGVTYTVGKSIGNALIRSSAVLLGNDPLSDPYLPYVVKINEHLIGQPDHKPKKNAQFSCPICNEDMKSGPKLARHLMDKKAHAEEAEAEPESDSDDAIDQTEATAEEVE